MGLPAGKGAGAARCFPGFLFDSAARCLQAVPQLLKKPAKLFRRFAALFFRFFLFLLVLVHKALLL